MIRVETEGTAGSLGGYRVKIIMGSVCVWGVGGEVYSDSIVSGAK